MNSDFVGNQASFACESFLKTKRIAKALYGIIITVIRFLSKAKKAELKGTALLRLDFNTEDEWRMKAAIPTIRHLEKISSKIVILSHRGRPEKKDRKLSLKKDALQLKKLLKKKVIFIPHFQFAAIRHAIKNAPEHSLFLLENLRFHSGETRNSPLFAKRLASVGNFYVNEAFAVSHRTNASLAAITRYLPSYAGLMLEREMYNLSRVMQKPKKPLVIIFGGGKAHDKLPAVQYFKNKADSFILGGAMSNTVLRAMGFHIGHSAADQNPDPIIKEIVRYKNLLLPVDYNVARNALLDIGPRSVRFFGKKIKSAGTIIWNGPFGVIEKRKFQAGTLGIARAIAANRKAFSLVGGGETVMFAKKHRLDKKFSFISTGGGAMLEFLAGKKLPGIAALERNQGRASPSSPRRRREALQR